MQLESNKGGSDNVAVFPSQTLRDLIQNNIDYVAKQVGVINDFLFGPTSDGTDEISEMPFILHTNQLFWVNPQTFGAPNNWTQYAVGNVNLDGTGLSISCYDYLSSNYGIQSSWDAIVDSGCFEYISSYTYSATLDEMGVDYIYNNDQFIQGVKNDSVVYPVYFDSDFNGNSGHQQLQLALSPKQTYSYRGEICDTWNVASGFLSDRFYFQQLDSDNYPSRMVIFPNSHSRNTWTYIDNSTVQTINYNGDTIYNYYNDSGDIIINGGGGTPTVPIMPIGGLAYADVKFILDSLVDELNLNFDFEGDGLPPLNYAPTLDEIRYGDYSDFYIEKLHQYDSLPAAPTFDGSVDFGDIPKVVGESANSYLGLLGTGLSALLCGCFITAFIVKKMGR